MNPMKRRASTTSLVLIALAVAAALGLGALLLGSDDSSSKATADTFVVRKGDFDVTVPASGELAAMNQIEVENELETRAVIIEIVEEGEYVKEGDVLFKLNDEETLNRVKDMEDAVNNSTIALETAEADLEIIQKEAESALSEADLAIELAELALQSWEEGERVSRLEELDLAIETANKNFQRLKERFEASKRLRKQEFISEDEFKRDEISLIEAEATLKQAERDKQVYLNYTIKQDRKTKESNVEQAKDERERIEARYNARIKSHESTVRSRRRQLESDKERLADARKQLEHCVVRAPSDGLVVYASSLDRGGWRDDDQPPQVGTELRRNEDVIVLPDTSEMVAEVKVNEALSGLIEKGQRATIVSDAMPGNVFEGEVLGIGVLAESGGWRDPNRRDYTVRIKLKGDNEHGLKPSMRCKANIFVDRVEDATYVPVQAVFRNGGTAFVYQPDGSGYAQRAVDIGRSSELYVEVNDGLEPGQTVLTREPSSENITVTLKSTDRDGRGDRRRGPGDAAEDDPKRVAAGDEVQSPQVEPGS